MSAQQPELDIVRAKLEEAHRFRVEKAANGHHDRKDAKGSG